ncbi:MAG: hypothetical protein H0U80_05320, partial [Solirubrobacterales bacterium]|nr:hypothetical protein [Solirubrobacterales bacterium]
LRQDAREEAERLRGDAGRQARDHVNRVAEVARGLLDRIEAMDRELGSLLDGLRAGTQRLSADLSLLQASVEEVREAAQPPSGIVEESESSGDADPGSSPAAATDEEALLDPPGATITLDEPALPPDPVGDDGSEVLAATDAFLPHESPVADAGGDEHAAAERDGARMVALNMVLNGVTRDDTRHHIEQNFDIGDVEALLDDVYARAGQ